MLIRLISKLSLCKCLGNKFTRGSKFFGKCQLCVRIYRNAEVKSSKCRKSFFLRSEGRDGQLKSIARDGRFNFKSNFMNLEKLGVISSASMPALLIAGSEKRSQSSF